MDDPEYTERQINEALKAHTDLPITVSWDGYEPSRDETANFEIYFEGETTDLVVWDRGPSFQIAERLRPSFYSECDWAVRYDVLAKKIIKLIEADIASGKLGEEE